MLLSEAFNTYYVDEFILLINKVLNNNVLSVQDIDTIISFKLRKLFVMSEYPCSNNVYYNSTNNVTSVTRIFYNKEEAENHLNDCIIELTKKGYIFISNKIDTLGKKYVMSYTVCPKQ